MPLTRSSLRQFLELSKPYESYVLDTPLSRQETNEEKVRVSESAIQQVLAESEGGWPIEALFRLRKNVEISVYLQEASIAQWRLLYTIFDSLRDVQRCKKLDDRTAWTHALKNALEAINAHWFRQNMSSESREKVVADALRQLRRKGFDARIDGRGPWIVPSDFIRLCGRIEKKIKNVGGLHMANALLDSMRRVGRVRDGSFIHARTPHMLVHQRAESGTPWHFLYSLAVKQLSHPTRPRNVTLVLQSMEDLARLLAAAIDVEPHSSYENMSITGSTLPEALNDTLVYDEMFAFPQWQPLAARTLVPAWFTALEAEGCTFPIMPPSTWSKFANCLLSRSRPAALVPVVTTDFTSIDIPYSDAQRLIAACCPTPDEVNAMYRTPVHTKARTAIYYPILPGKDRMRFLQPQGIAARALCERIYTLMRGNIVPDLENRMGRALERLTAAVLQNAGYEIAVRNGKYANPNGGNDLEIDLAVETADRVFLFECKKKALTNAARRGETLAALRDLEQSFLYLVQQLAQHEAALRSQEKLIFRDGSVLSLKGRPVEKFCISLFDHGSLQHRDMTMAMLELFIGKRLTIDDPSASDLEKVINHRLDRIDRSLRTILDAQSGKDAHLVHAFAMSTWWLSVDQLQYAILRGGNLWSGIERVRHLTRRSGDLIYDMLTTVTLNEVGEALFDLNKRMDNRSLL